MKLFFKNSNYIKITSFLLVISLSTLNFTPLLLINIVPAIASDTGLIAKWSAEGNADDSVGTNDGTLIGGTTFEPGKYGQAFSFDGNVDTVNIPKVSAWDFGTSSFTISAWFKTNTAGYANIIRYDSGWSGSGLWGVRVEPDGKIKFVITDAGRAEVFVQTDNTYIDNNWHFVTAVRDGAAGKLRIYIDGAPVAEETSDQGTNVVGAAGAIPVIGGGAWGGEYFTGLIDEVKIYNRALTGSEVANIYGLVSYWSADGNANDSIGINHGTLTGDTSYVAGKVGQAFSFDGSGDFVNLPKVPTWDFGTSSFSISAWFKTNTASGNIIGYDTGYSGGLWGVMVDPGGKIKFVIASASRTEVIVNTDNVYTDNNWHFVTAVRDGTAGKLRIYIDGLIAATETPDWGENVVGAAGAYPAIGRNGSYNGSYFTGSIDEVKIYDRALSADEIAGLYEFTPPSVESVNPTNGATNIPVNSTVTATFSENMNPLTLDNTTFTLNNGVSGVVLYNPDTKTATFAPLSNLDYNTTYTATITTAVQDSTGNNMLADYSWSFTTEREDGLISYWPADGNVDDVIGANNGTLMNGATASEEGKFGQAFNFDGTDDYIEIPHSSSLNLTSGLTLEAWFNLRTTGHYSTIFSKADYYGSESLTSYGLAATPGGGLQVALYGTYPADWWATGDGLIETNQWNHVALTWDGTIGPENNVRLYLNGSLIQSWTKSATPLNITEQSLTLGSMKPPTYYNRMNGLLDEARIYNRALSSAEVAGLYDFAPPSVDSVSPVSNAVDVPVNSIITAAFSEDMDAATINTSSFSVSGPGGEIEGAVDYEAANKIATFNPSSNLVYSTTYTASISSAVKDLAGNSLPSDYTWSFTTENAPPDTSPDVFNFVDQSDVQLNTIATSNPITISGINTPTPISITGGEYSLNGGLYTSTPGTVNNGDIVVVQQMSSSLYSTTTDAVLTIGDVSDTFSVTTLADTLPPTTSFSIDLPEPDGNDNWYLTIPTMTLQSNEDGKTYYKWNASENYHEYNSPIAAAEGASTFYYYSTDNVGNAEQPNEVQLKVDSSPPNVEFDESMPGEGSFIRGDFLIISDVTEPYWLNQSGIKSVELHINGEWRDKDELGGTVSWPLDTTSLPDGLTTVKLVAEDNAGNTSVIERTYIIDNTIPITGYASTANASNFHVKGTISVPASVSDATSGISRVRLYVGSTKKGEKTSSPYTFSVDTTKLTNGKKTFKVVAYDKAGNSSGYKTRYYYVDNTKPTIPSAYMSPSTPAKGKYAKAYYKVKDTVAPYVYVTLQIRTTGGKVLSKATLGNKTKGKLLYKSIKMPKTKGTYIYRVIAKDYAGNRLIKNIKFTVK